MPKQEYEGDEIPQEKEPSEVRISRHCSGILQRLTELDDVECAVLLIGTKKGDLLSRHTGSWFGSCQLIQVANADLDARLEMNLMRRYHTDDDE